MEGVELWWKGPKWLADREQWPRDVVTVSTPGSQGEAKVIRKGFAGARDKTDEFDVLLEKFPFRKTFRVGAWILRFVYNTRKRKSERTIGPIVTEEIEQQKCFWTACAQRSGKNSETFENDELQLNLQDRRDGVLECRGRIQGNCPSYLPETHPFTEKMIMQSHLATLHGGVGLTMTTVR